MKRVRSDQKGSGRKWEEQPPFVRFARGTVMRVFSPVRAPLPKREGSRRSYKRQSGNSLAADKAE